MFLNIVTVLGNRWMYLSPKTQKLARGALWIQYHLFYIFTTYRKWLFFPELQDWFWKAQMWGCVQSILACVECWIFNSPSCFWQSLPLRIIITQLHLQTSAGSPPMIFELCIFILVWSPTGVFINYICVFALGLVILHGTHVALWTWTFCGFKLR